MAHEIQKSAADLALHWLYNAKWEKLMESSGTQRMKDPVNALGLQVYTKVEKKSGQRYEREGGWWWPLQKYLDRLPDFGMPTKDEITMLDPDDVGKKQPGMVVCASVAQPVTVDG